MLSLRLAIFAMKKKKEACILLMFFVLLAVMFLDIGLSFFKKANQKFYETTLQLNEAHFIVPCTVKAYKDEYADYIRNWSGVSEFEKEEVVYMPVTKNNCNRLELGAFFFNQDAKRKIAPLIIVEEDKNVPVEKSIYVPIQLKNENVSLGKEYSLTYRGTTYHFLVAGFFETTTYNNLNSGFYKYFVPDTTYKKLSGEIGEAYVLSARFVGEEEDIIGSADKLKQSFLNDTTYASDTQNVQMSAMSYEEMQVKGVMNLFIGIAILFAVAILISMVVIFVVMNYIREDINKSMDMIGTLQALGYSIKQIMAVYILEYTVLGIGGGILGVAFSYLTGMAMSPYLTGLCGFRWTSFYHPVEDILSFVILLILITFVGILAVRKIYTLTPVEALGQRNGSKKGYVCHFPLQNGNLPLNLHIAVKNILIYLRSNIVYGLIVAIGSFAIGVTFIVFLNFSTHTDVLLSVVGYELADLQVKVSKGCDTEAFSKELLNDKEVRKTNISAMGEYVKYKNETIKTLIEDDFSKLEYCNPYSGGVPQTENEVLISSLLSQTSGKKTGDSIVLSANGMEKEYLVSGIFSSTNGFVVYMNESGIQKLYPDFQFNCVDVYLKEDVSPKEFEKKLQSTYKVSGENDSTSVAEQKIARLLADYGVSSVSYSIWKDGVEICSGNSSAFQIFEITDLKSYAKAQIESYSKSLSLIVLVVFFTMLAIVGGVLHVTTKSEILKNRKEYGILKALGFTTKNIIEQVSLRFFITTILGSLTGALMSFLVAPKMFGILFELMGVTQIHMNGYPLVLLLYSVILSMLLYLVTRTTCRRIRKITTYDLMSE